VKLLRRQRSWVISSLLESISFYLNNGPNISNKVRVKLFLCPDLSRSKICLASFDGCSFISTRPWYTGKNQVHLIEKLLFWHVQRHYSENGDPLDNRGLRTGITPILLWLPSAACSSSSLFRTKFSSATAQQESTGSITIAEDNGQHRYSNPAVVVILTGT